MKSFERWCWVGDEKKLEEDIIENKQPQIQAFCQRKRKLDENSIINPQKFLINFENCINKTNDEFKNKFSSWTAVDIVTTKVLKESSSIFSLKKPKKFS